ncbi:PAS domain-containing sensor histidine kinase [Pedobacter agri]|uniref:PAS domain-containing sensor histidine kinase n=1 Tax=Pedobacter agri TaxID=454586 RepID=UPI00292FB6FF|nr:PAS domain-containing sensor histidine kinase [Pedobacter agri]
MAEIRNDIFYKMGSSTSDGYFIYDVQQSDFVYVNQAFVVMFNLSEHPVNTKQLWAAVHDEDKDHLQSCYEELLADGGSKKYVFRMVTADEKVRYLKCTAYLDQENNEIYGILDDFTTTQENKTHIEQINGRKNVTLEVLSHDLKEPLGMIKMAVSSMENKIGRVAEEDFKGSLQFIADVCERNLKLIRSMVNHEFLKSSVVAIKRERVDLIWELKDVVRFYKRSHLREIRNFTFSSSQEKIFMFLDSMKFMQVINNLVSNAIKFTSFGGNIEVNAEDRGETVVVSVSDNGIGIPEKIKEKLFQNEKSVLRKGLNGEESGGLGMNIIKDIVDLHQGRIWLVSEQGIGTTFYIELPK